jgi:uncharacterized phage protein (TIGR01671 family)
MRAWERKHMQREIKFRGQCYDDKKWIYGSLLEDNIIVTNGATVVEADYISFDDEWSSVLPETVGQYTGLKDKNGKEIYEGDKCEVYRTCVYAEGFIKFHQGSFIFEEFKTGYILRLCDLQFNEYKIKVIGTVYDNPKLLQEERHG